MAERAHVGYGIWDVVFGDEVAGGAAARPSEVAEARRKAAAAAEPDALACLEETIAEDEASPFHYSRFVVVRDVHKSDTPAVAAACGFLYPGTQLKTAVAGLADALERRRRGGGKRLRDGFSRLSFLGEAFPDNPAVDKLFGNEAWMIEAVFVAKDYRRRGLGELVTTGAAARGNATGVSVCGINVAVGNGALRVYERMGFDLIGTGDSDACEGRIGVRGFHVLTSPLVSLVHRSLAMRGGDELPVGCTGKATCRCTKCKAELAEMGERDEHWDADAPSSPAPYISPEERRRRDRK